MGIGDWITLAAVIVALGIGVVSILHTHRMQKQERRERLLNEIIEWAMEVDNCNIGTSGSDVLKAEEDPQGKIDRILTHNQLTEWGIRLQALETRGKYINTSVQIFNDAVKTAVKELNNDLDKFIQSLFCCAEIQYRGLSSEKYKEQHDESLKLLLIMDKSAQKVIEEVTKIKNKGIK